MIQLNKAVSDLGASAETVQKIQQFIMETDPKNQNNMKIQKNVSAPKYKVVNIDSLMNGKYSAAMDGHIAINGVVARVVVDRCNFDDFLTDKTKFLQSRAPKMRGTKRKLQETKLEELLSDSPTKEPKKMKSRAKKSTQIDLDYSEPSSESTDVDFEEKIDKKKRKLTENTKLKQIKRQSTQVLSVKNRRFNGGTTSSVSTSRVRKPNTRLQDFVISSSVRSYVPSPTNKPAAKELTPLPKEKPLKKLNKNAVDDPLSITNVENKNRTSNVVLKTTRKTEEVRSFLPVFDESLQSDESDVVEEQPKKKKKPIKEKENQINNLQVKNNAGKSIKSNQSDYSPPKLRSSNEIKTKIDIAKLQKSIAKTIENQKKTVNNNTVTEQKETKMNGSNPGVKKNSKYVLVDTDVARSRNKPQKVGDVDFNKLVRSLKLVKLPAANWKIRIVVSKQQTITEVTFTNKEVNERCIKFSRTIAGYVITFGKSIVSLLGAPSKISSFNDVSILLDIVHHISPNDPVLEYSTSSNV